MIFFTSANVANLFAMFQNSNLTQVFAFSYFVSPKKKRKKMLFVDEIMRIIIFLF